jgi:hypothetical protein
MIVRLFLLAAAALAAYWVVRARPSGRRLAVARLGVLSLGALWVVAVLRPGVVTWVAHRVGVGRGTDLILYVLVVGFTFASVGVYRKLRELEDRVAQLTRAHALLEHEVAAERTPEPRV